jgi:hypothetical protein
MDKLHYEINDTQKVRATLFLDDQLFATGQAEISRNDRDISFFPEPTRYLDSSLRGAISLKIEGIEGAIHLLHPQELFEVGDHLVWFFVER